MTTLLRVVGGLVAGCLLVAGCGGSGGKESLAAGKSTTTTAAAGSDASRSDESGDDERADENEDGASGSTPGGGEPADTGGGGGSETPVLSGEPPGPTGIVTSVDPLCAGRGSPTRVVVKTDPLADVSYAMSFADGENHGLFGLAQADLQGNFVWNIVLPADAALGDAEIIVVSGHPETGAKKGRGTVRITETGACP